MAKIREVVYCEFLKMRHSKICRLVFLGTWAVPLYVVILQIRNILNGRGSTLFDFYDTAYLFLMNLSAVFLFSIVAAWLFGREYTENTLKTLFAAPISKGRYLAGKFIALFLCIMILMMLTWAEILAFAVVCNLLFGIGQMNVPGIVYFLVRMLYGAALLYAVTTPFAYIAIRTKSFFAPILAAVPIALFNIIFSNLPIAAYFPWTAPYWVLTKRVESFLGGNGRLSLLVICAVGVVGIAASVRCFWRRDVI